MADFNQFKPIDYGNILAQNAQTRGRQINNALAQRQLDPNSPEYRLREAKIAELEREAAGGGGVGDLSPKDATYESIQKFRKSGNYNDLVRYNKPPAPFRVDAGDSFEIYVNNPLTGQPELVRTIPKNLAPNQELDYIGDAAQAKEQGTLFGQSGQPYVSPDDIDLGVTVAPTRASIAGDVAAQTVKSTAAAEESLPTNISKNRRILADNIGVVETIDDLLTAKDGRTALSYAYGRTNAMLPDWMKTEQMVDSEALRNRVVASVQLENVKKLKGTGPITENEQKILANAASVLNNPLISVELAEKEMRRVKAMFATWSRENEAAIARGELDPNFATAETYEQKKARILKAKGE